MTTPEKIRKKRLLRKYSQTEMAGYLGLSQRAYSKIETGETQLKLNRLEEIAKLLNVKISELLPSDNVHYNTNPNIDGNGREIKQYISKENELYEKLIKRLSDEINYLKGLVQTLVK